MEFIMKNQKMVTVRISEELLAKLAHVSDKEGRSLNNQFNFMARNAVAYFERTHGKISAADQKAALDKIAGEIVDEE